MEVNEDKLFQVDLKILSYHQYTGMDQFTKFEEAYGLIQMECP